MGTKSLLRACAAAAILVAIPVPSLAPAAEQEKAQEKVWRYGLSLFGELKYPFFGTDAAIPTAPLPGALRIRLSAICICLTVVKLAA